jgi:hypothetical protein
MIGAINAPRTRVRLVTPYFRPDGTLHAALGVAARRGVAVDIVIPHGPNHPVVDWATHADRLSPRHWLPPSSVLRAPWPSEGHDRQRGLERPKSLKRMARLCEQRCEPVCARVCHSAPFSARHRRLANVFRSANSLAALERRPALSGSTTGVDLAGSTAADLERSIERWSAASGVPATELNRERTLRRPRRLVVRESRSGAALVPH